MNQKQARIIRKLCDKFDLRYELQKKIYKNLNWKDRTAYIRDAKLNLYNLPIIEKYEKSLS
jgi:hypothetical protein